MEGFKVSAWLEAGKTKEEDMSSANRREKRTIPEAEKDARYWEKRQRNNIAAKRSRENKRLMETSTKKKAAILERENAMLRREIEVLKNKFGIPLNQSFLSEEQQEDFQKEWKNNAMHLANQKLEHDANSDDDSKNTYTMSAGCSVSPSPGKHEANDVTNLDYSERGRSCIGNKERENGNLSTNLPFYGMLWASAMAGYSENGNREAKHRKSYGFTPELGQIPTQTPFQYYPRYGVAQQQRPLSPTRARALKKGHYKQYTLDDRQNSSHPYTRAPSYGSADENADIKMKLLQLSVQVEEMKHIFIKKE